MIRIRQAAMKHNEALSLLVLRPPQGGSAWRLMGAETQGLRRLWSEKMLTQERLKELLNYDPQTGIFTWREMNRWRRKTPYAGTRSHHGYWAVKLDGVIYMHHRLAWLYVHGEFPPCGIDHREGKSNAISNLRLSDQKLNNANQKFRGNKTGFKGVHPVPLGVRKFCARIKVDRKVRHLGVFMTAREAAEAYDTAAIEAFGEYARTNRLMGLL